MTCEECIHKAVCYLVDSVTNDHAQKCGDFISGCKELEQESCENCINRQAVLNYIRDNYRRWFINDDDFMQFVNGIKDIVPVTSQPKTERWKCERCGKLIPYMADFCHECADILLGEPPVIEADMEKGRLKT